MARYTPAADGGPAAEAGARGPAVMVGLGCAAAFAALSLFVPLQNIVPPSLEELADDWLVPGLALIGFVVGYLFTRKIGVRPVALEEKVDEAAQGPAEAPTGVRAAALPVTEPGAPANPLIAEPLDRLGPVQLVERLAMAVERNPPPARNTARAAQLAAQLSALSAMPGATQPPADASDNVADEDPSDLEGQREVDDRHYSSLLDMSLPRAHRATKAPD